MAIEKVVNIVANTKQAVTDVKKLFDELLEAEQQQQALNESAEEMEDAYKKSSKEATKDIEKVGDSAKKQSKVVQGLKKSVQAVGTALKALGIGLVIALVAKFTQVLSENQKVVDFFNEVSNTMGIILNKIVGTFAEAFTKASELTGGFDALGKVIGGSLKIAFNGLKITLLTLQGAFASLKLAYEKVFGNEEGIKKAQKNLDEIGQNINDTLKDTVDAGKQVVNNLGEAVGEVVTAVDQTTKAGIKAIDEIDVKSAYAQGQAIARNKRNFELLALQQQRLQLQYQFQAEALRQVRDDDTKSIAERIKANDELSEVLKKQLEAESATINARISALQQEQKLLGFTQERQNEIYQLQTDLIDVAERLKGAESEQLSNKNALLKEQQDLIQSQFDTQNEIREKQLEFEAEQADTELEKLEKQKELLKLQQEQDLAELERKRELYAEDTQNRVDAENEYLLKKQEIDNALIENAKKVSEKQKAIDQAVKDTTVDLAGKTFDILAELAGEGTELAKGVAVAQATMNTYQGITAALSAQSVIPDPVGSALKFVNAGLIGVAGALNVKKILSTKVSKGGGGGVDSSAGGSAPQAPSFNLVAGTGTNQIAESLATERQPVKAYVVASEMTNQQALENNISSTASIG